MSYLTVILIAVAAFVFGALAVFAFTARRLATAEEKGSRIPELESGLQRALAEHAEINARASGLQVQLEQERKASAEKLALLEEAQAKLSDAFKALSSAALRENNQSFLELAKSTLEKFQETAKGELEKRQQAIGELVKPLRESLDKVDKNINDIEKSRVSAYSSLSEQLKSLTYSQAALQTETTKLSTALSTTRTAGTWGELQLRRVVELAGMVEHCDFTEQESAGGQRPDLVVRLPMGQHIVVDAKAPTDAFREAAAADDPKIRAAKFLEHAQRVRSHVDALSARAYWEQFKPSPEFVVLFLPGDQFLAFALEADPALVDRAIRSRVLLATPSTLVALLKASAYGWRQESVSKNAEEISKNGRELYDRIATLTEHFERLRKNLDGAIGAYNDAVGGLERSVLPGARKFLELGAVGGKTVKHPEQVSESLRTITAPELLVSTDERSLPLDSKKE